MWLRRSIRGNWKRLGALTLGAKLGNGNWLHIVDDIPSGCHELVEISGSRAAARRDVTYHGCYPTHEQAKDHARLLLALGSIARPGCRARWRARRSPSQ